MKNLLMIFLTLSLLIGLASADAINTVRGFNYIDESGIVLGDNVPFYFGTGTDSAGVKTADLKFLPDGTNIGITGAGAWDMSSATGAFYLPAANFYMTYGGIVSANKSITYAAGSGGLDASLGTGTTKTTTGTNYLNGDSILAAGKDFSMASGAGNVDLSSSTGTYGSTTGAQTLNGNTDTAASKYINVTTADYLTVGGVIVPQETVITVQINANSVDENIFIASDAWQVTHIEEVHTVAGNDAGAVNMTVTKCDGTDAPSAGDVLLQSVIDLKGTANTVQAGNITGISEAYLQLADGDRLAIDYSGTLTTLAGGSVTVHLKRI